MHDVYIYRVIERYIITYLSYIRKWSIKGEGKESPGTGRTVWLVIGGSPNAGSTIPTSETTSEILRLRETRATAKQKPVSHLCGNSSWLHSLVSPFFIMASHLQGLVSLLLPRRIILRDDESGVVM
jgi:hypothetical protein